MHFKIDFSFNEIDGDDDTLLVPETVTGSIGLLHEYPCKRNCRIARRFTVSRACNEKYINHDFHEIYKKDPINRKLNKSMYDHSTKACVSKIFKLRQAKSIKNICCSATNWHVGFYPGMKVELLSINAEPLTLIVLSIDRLPDQNLGKITTLQWVQAQAESSLFVCADSFLDRSRSIYAAYTEPDFFGYLTPQTRLIFKDFNIIANGLKTKILNSPRCDYDIGPVNSMILKLKVENIDRENVAIIHPFNAYRLGIKTKDIIIIVPKYQDQEILLHKDCCFQTTDKYTLRIKTDSKCDIDTISLSLLTSTIFLERPSALLIYRNNKDIPTAESISIIQIRTSQGIDRIIDQNLKQELKLFFANRKLIPQSGCYIRLNFSSFQVKSNSEFLPHGSKKCMALFQIRYDSSPEHIELSKDISSFWVDAKRTKIEQLTSISGNSYILKQFLLSKKLIEFDKNVENSLCGRLLSPKTKVLLHATDISVIESLLVSCSAKLGCNLFEIDCLDLAMLEKDILETVIMSKVSRALYCSPVLVHLKSINILSQSFEVLSLILKILQQVMQAIQDSLHISTQYKQILASTTDYDQTPMKLKAIFYAHVHVNSSCGIKELCKSDVGMLQNLDKAACLSKEKIDTVFKFANTLAKQRQYDSGSYMSFQPTSYDFEEALARVNLSLKSFDNTKIDKVYWSDIGGLENARKEIFNSIELPLKHPELFPTGLQLRSGLLLYGPPGTGKTMLAKVVANTLSINFLSVKGPELLDMYIGESEANIRNLFQRARDAQPSVIFFDEIDSIAPKRGLHGDSGGVIDRVVCQLLVEMDASESNQQVFVIAATNRPDLLDPSLLRPGRFDRLIYIPPPFGFEAKQKIMEAQTRNFTLDSDVDLNSISKICDEYMTGADLYALVSEAVHIALLRIVKQLEQDSMHSLKEEESRDDCIKANLTELLEQDYSKQGDQRKIIVCQSDFEYAALKIKASVSREQMNHYQSLQTRLTGTSIEN